MSACCLLPPTPQDKTSKCTGFFQGRAKLECTLPACGQDSTKQALSAKARAHLLPLQIKEKEGKSIALQRGFPHIRGGGGRTEPHGHRKCLCFGLGHPSLYLPCTYNVRRGSIETGCSRKEAEPARPRQAPPCHLPTCLPPPSTKREGRSDSC